MKMESIGGRKLALTLLMAAVGLAFTYYRGDIPSGLLAFMQTIFGAFVVGNVFEHMSSAAVKRKQPAVVQDNSADFAYLASEIEKVKAEVKLQQTGIEQANTSLATVQQAIGFIIDKAGFK